MSSTQTSNNAVEQYPAEGPGGGRSKRSHLWYVGSLGLGLKCDLYPVPCTKRAVCKVEGAILVLYRPKVRSGSRLNTLASSIFPGAKVSVYESVPCLGTYRCLKSTVKCEEAGRFKYLWDRLLIHDIKACQYTRSVFVSLPEHTRVVLVLKVNNVPSALTHRGALGRTWKQRSIFPGTFGNPRCSWTKILQAQLPETTY